MQLFAIIARGDDLNSGKRNVVISFLKQQLNDEQVQTYLALFDQFLEEQQAAARKRNVNDERASVKDSVKVLKICTAINKELSQKQKFIVLVRLLEFIKADFNITGQEMEFVSTVASTFNIDEKDFKEISDFILTKNTSENLLSVCAKKNPDLSHFIPSENLDGELLILRIPKIELFLGRYEGQDEIYMNGILMRSEAVYVLTNGCSIRGSKLSSLYYSDIISTYLKDKSDDQLDFTVKGIEHFFGGSKRALHPINLQEKSGNLIGIMGASGAGKSTLLHILNGSEKPSKGSVKINGIDLYADSKKVKGLIGYVAQDDVLIEELTVYQNLYYNAKMCFGDFNEQQLSERVDKTLQDIGLFEAKDVLVGSPMNKKISGGQRKRLNIALELIREPSVMFVDEPTSGLSSRDSENIMDLLKELSLKGKLVFVVIHQPSSDIYKMFDKMYILDTGGFPIYYGNPLDAIVYFKRRINHVKSSESECIQCGNVNPEQIFNIIESKVVDEYGVPTKLRKISPKEWNESYKTENNIVISDATEISAASSNAFKVANRLKQFGVYFTRDLFSKLANRQYLFINLLEAPALALILAFLVKFQTGDHYTLQGNDNLPAYLFMNIIVALFMGLTVSAEEIIKDRKLLKRESFLNLSWSSYLFSKVSLLFLISFIQTLTFVVIGNWIMGITGMTFSYWFVMFAISCFANLLGLNISATFNSAVTVYILIPILLIPQLLLSGVIVEFEKLHPYLSNAKYVPIAGDIMASRWGFEALAVNQFKNNEYEKEFYDVDRLLSESEFKKNYLLPAISAKADKFSMLTSADEKTKTLNLLNNELAKLPNSASTLHLPYTQASFLPELTLVKSYLSTLTDNYSVLYNQLDGKKNKISESLSKALPNKEEYIKWQKEHSNDNLVELVRNSRTTNKILETDKEFVQKADPIFELPEPSHLRAHFFSPYKSLFGNFIDTLWFNCIVIWCMSLILFVSLYFKAGERTSNWLAQLKWKSKS